MLHAGSLTAALHAKGSTDAGYRIPVLREPPYASSTPPELVSDFGGRPSFLCFIFFVLVAS